MHLFKYFHDQWIVYSLNSDFNFDGGFQAYWTRLFMLRKEKHPDNFGERPIKASFDIDADYKIRNTVDPPFTPYELTKKGYEDCMILICHYTCVNYYLRGGTEASILYCLIVVFTPIHLLTPRFAATKLHSRAFYSRVEAQWRIRRSIISPTPKS